MVGEGVLVGVDVTCKLGVLLDRVEKISGKAVIVVADDCLVKLIRDKAGGALVIAEGELPSYKPVLRSMNLSLLALRTLTNIADTLASYTRLQVEQHNVNPSDVRRRLPLAWKL